MSRTCPAAARGGFMLVPVLVTSFIVIAFTVVMARMAILEYAGDRQAQLEVCAAQVSASAQAWSRRHSAEFSGGAVVVLPMAEALPAGMTGTAELRLVETQAGGRLVECQITIERSGRRLVRKVAWPAG